MPKALFVILVILGIFFLLWVADEFGQFGFIIAFVLFVFFILPIASLVRSRRILREAGEQAETIRALKSRLDGLEHARLPELIKRVYELEKAQAGAPAHIETKPAVPPPAAMPAPPRAATAPPPPPATATPPPRPAAPAAIDATMLAAPGGAGSSPPAQGAHPPLSVSFEAPVAAPRRAMQWANWEELLGTNLLNKIGVAIFVLGGAFLTNLAMQEFGPGGRVFLLYLISAIFLGAGVIGESRERYRILARALLGGGWALAFSTTYALHNVEATRLVESPGTGFFLLFVVAAGMVAHSLRYNSEVVTGLAYALAFASVALSRMTIGTMGASAVLAASLIVVLWRRRWYHLEPVAIVAVYGLHWVWLWQVFEYLGGHKPFPDSTASSVLLTVYWLLFVISHFLRGEDEPAQKFSLAISFVLNAGGYMAVMGYQALYPHMKFWFLLGVGIAYFILCWISWRMARRMAFLLHSTLGSVLTLVAVPYRYAGARLELVWLAEAQALLYVGWRALDAHLRKLGWAALAVLATYVMFHDLSPRMAFWAPPNLALGSLLAALTAAYFFNSRFAPRLLGESCEETDRLAAQISAPIGTGFLAAALWVATPFMWPGFLWAAAALGLAEIGRRLDAPQGDAILRWCGHGLAFLAALRLLAVNLELAPPVLGVSMRVVTIALACALFYFSARRIVAAQDVPGEASGEFELGAFIRSNVASVYTWLATALVALMLWYELTSTAVALAWALLGVAVLEAGRGLGDRPLVAQGHTLLALSFVRMCIADLNADVELGPVTARALTVPLLALVYFYAGLTSDETSGRARRVLLWLGTISVAALLRFEFPPQWVAVGWAAMVVALFFAGRRFDLPDLRNQSYFLAVLVGVRCGLDNVFQTAAWAFTTVRTVTVVAASALLAVPLAASLISRSSAEPAPESEAQVAPFRRWWRAMDRSPHQILFFVPAILLTVLLGFEVRRGYLTGAWALEAFLLFMIAIKLGEASYRRFSLALFLFCVGRIVAVDAWSLDKAGRVIVFMGLGLALILVSLLYTRMQEAWRKYL